MKVRLELNGEGWKATVEIAGNPVSGYGLDPLKAVWALAERLAEIVEEKK